MAGVVSFGELEPWFINGWGYRLLMERAVNEEIDQVCADEFLSALHNHGLHFGLMDRQLAAQVAASLRLVAVALQHELAASADPYEQSAAERFALLVSRLDQMSRRLRDRHVDAISAQIAHEDASLLRRLGEAWRGPGQRLWKRHQPGSEGWLGEPSPNHPPSHA